MSDIAIRVENLSKRYRIGLKEEMPETFVDSITTWLKSPLANFRQLRKLSHFSQNGHDPEDVIWALKDVSFEIKQGEVIGVIGRNGAGKSTLLKILSRITEPSSGRAIVNGRVSSLLEVGTGFHPDLTGRENVYLNGTILGMSKSEIDRKFDEIVAFAEVEKFIDTPVKRYSSGMQVRLAFSVAAHLEPEMLLVDEVLAVGDATFQKKCLGRMGRVASEGRTILFVSHNMAAIQNLCERVILLDKGEVSFVGSTEEGIQKYLEAGAEFSQGTKDLTQSERRPGCQQMLKMVRLLNSAGEVKEHFLSGEMMKIEVTINPVTPLTSPQVGVGIDDHIGTRLFSLATYLSNSELPPLTHESKVVCQVNELCLAPGRYFLSFSVGAHNNLYLDGVEQAISFEVEPSDFYGNGKLPITKHHGRVLVQSQWQKVD